MDELYETVHSLLEETQEHTKGAQIRYIAVSVVFAGYSVDFRVAPHTPETVLNETHEEAVARVRTEGRRGR